MALPAANFRPEPRGRGFRIVADGDYDLGVTVASEATAKIVAEALGEYAETHGFGSGWFILHDLPGRSETFRAGTWRPPNAKREIASPPSCEPEGRCG